MHRASLPREPLLLPAAALGLGILLSGVYRLPIPLVLTAGGSAFLLLTTALWRADLRHLRIWAFSFTFLTLGLATPILHPSGKRPELSVADGESALLSGCVVNPPVFSPGREQFTLEIAPQKSVRISLNLADHERLPLDYGQQVEVAAKIRSPRNFGNPDAFDYVAYLATQHIYWTGSVASSSDVRLLPDRCGSRALSWLFGIRTWALDRLDRLYPDDRHTAALLQATLLGETSGVEKRWTNDFRLTGTYHALVISGQHVSVLAFTILTILSFVRVRRVPALGVATIACWLYAFMTGFSAPVMRAAAGFTLYLIASYCFRRTRVLNILAAIGLVYLVFIPAELYDPSFQLSFLSAAAIAAFALPLMERYTQPLRAAVKHFDQVSYDPLVEPRGAQWRVELRLLARTVQVWTRLSPSQADRLVVGFTRAGTFASEAVLVSSCVQFGLALPMVTYFHRLSITGLTANVLVIPLLSLVVPFGFGAMLTMLQPLAWITKSLLQMAEWVATWHVQFEPSWRMGAIPLAVSLSFVATLLLFAWTIRQHRRWVPIPFACSLLCFLVLCLQPWAPLLHPGRLEVTAIDVGQGDSIFVAFPNGQTMLVDAGGFPGFTNMKRKPQMDIGEDVVSPYLWSRRIRHLDYAVLSHGHSDHMGGLAAILDNFHPATLWTGAEPASAEWSAVEQHAVRAHTRILPLTRSAQLPSIGGVSIRVLAPAPDYVPGTAATNNDSLVLEISYGKRGVILTGDAETQVEADLVAGGVLRPVTLLKVGHHGSKTSSTAEFLDVLHPDYAFISDGYKNQFHHPHPTVIARLADRNVHILRTDERGLSTFLTDGDKVEVSSFH